MAICEYASDVGYPLRDGGVSSDERVESSVEYSALPRLRCSTAVLSCSVFRHCRALSDQRRWTGNGKANATRERPMHRTPPIQIHAPHATLHFKHSRNNLAALTTGEHSRALSARCPCTCTTSCNHPPSLLQSYRVPVRAPRYGYET
jgi:hypothetical protein